MFPRATLPTIGTNDVSGLIAPIGGFPGKGDGGYILVTQVVNEGNTWQSNAPPWLIDVERWRVLASFGETALAAGGMMGRNVEPADGLCLRVGGRCSARPARCAVHDYVRGAES